MRDGGARSPGSRGLRLLVELHHGEEVALVRERDRRHARLGDRGHQFGHAHDAVEQRILGVQPQMHELAHGSGCSR